MRVAVIGGQAMVHGFRLAGVEGYVLSPGEEAARCFDKLAADPDLAVILISRSVHETVASRVEDLRMKHPLPVVLVLPDRGEELEVQSNAEILETFLGLKV